jgi:predicted metallopeptidase
MTKNNEAYEEDVLSREIAKQILEKYNDRFPTINLSQIKFVRFISKKSTKFASVCPIKFPASLYTDDKYVITTYAATYDQLDSARQNLVIYHELMHISPLFNGSTCKHDTEDFATILKEFGPYWTSNTEIRDILK